MSPPWRKRLSERCIGAIRFSSGSSSTSDTVSFIRRPSASSASSSRVDKSSAICPSVVVDECERSPLHVYICTNGSIIIKLVDLKYYIKQYRFARAAASTAPRSPAASAPNVMIASAHTKNERSICMTRSLGSEGGMERTRLKERKNEAI